MPAGGVGGRSRDPCGAQRLLTEGCDRAYKHPGPRPPQATGIGSARAGQLLGPFPALGTFIFPDRSSFSSVFPPFLRPGGLLYAQICYFEALCVVLRFQSHGQKPETTYFSGYNSNSKSWSLKYAWKIRKHVERKNLTLCCCVESRTEYFGLFSLQFKVTYTLVQN